MLSTAGIANSSSTGTAFANITNHHQNQMNNIASVGDYSSGETQQ